MRRRLALQLFGPSLLATAVAFFLAYRYIEPAPPGRVVMATGGSAGAYQRFGEQYRLALAEAGITLELRASSGSVENLRLLTSGQVDIAFVQSGVANPARYPDLWGLASLYLEPLWIVTHEPRRGLKSLAGARVAIGAEGSGTRALSRILLEALGVEVRFRDLTGHAALDALRAGTLDAAFFVMGVEAPLVQRLLGTRDLALLELTRAEALVRRFRFLSQVRLPRGVLDLAADLPDNDLVLVAPAATLLVGADFHPALVDLWLRIGTRLHGGGGLVEAPDVFPSPRFLDLPLHPDAERYFRQGPSLLNSYLPFWLATQIDRLKILALPLLTLLLPLAKILPPTYRWRIRSRVYRWYRELLTVDRATAEDHSPESLTRARAELARIEREVRMIQVPLPYTDALYHLRHHIELIRTRLERLDIRGEGRERK